MADRQGDPLLMALAEQRIRVAPAAARSPGASVELVATRLAGGVGSGGGARLRLERLAPAMAVGASGARAAASAVPPATTAVIEPAAAAESGAIWRRDPLLPPLIDADIWRDWVLAVRLNGIEVTSGGLFVEAPDGSVLAILLTQARDWRLKIDEARAITFQGEPFYPLAAIEGAVWQLDPEALTIDITAPPQAFEPSALQLAPERRIPPSRGQGAFFDYDLVYQAGRDLRERLDGLVELGAFAAPGVLTTSLKLDDLTSSAELVRLESRFIRDLPEQRASLRVGDSLTAGGSFSQPTRFAGVQFATNFATDPSFVSFPIPAIGGLADQSSVVEVFIDNLRRASREVPPGPFSLEGLPVLTGAGELQLKVTDLLGRERLVTQRYYVSGRLLRPGLHDFSYELGTLRRRYGEESFDYGEAVLVGTHRYGLTDSLTLEAHGEAAWDRQSLSLGGSARLGLLGVVTAGIGISRDDDDGLGGLAQLAYEYQGRVVDVGLRTRYTTRHFAQFGEIDELRRVDQAGVGFDLAGYGRLGLLFANEDTRDSDDRRSLSANLSLPMGPGTLLASAGRTFSPDTDLILGLVYTMPLGGNRSLALDARSSDQRRTAGAALRQTRGASDLGLDWRIAGEIGDDPRTLDLRANYQSPWGGTTLEASRFDGSNNLRLGVDGSLALVDGSVRASRRLGSAFGLVRVPGVRDARVYLDNREVGRTDADGALLLPTLLPYQANRLRVEVEDLPLDTILETDQLEAVPYERSGVAVTFPVRRLQQASAQLQLADGTPLPPAAELGAEGVWVRVGRGGFAVIDGARPEPVTVRGTVDGIDYVCVLPAAPAGELQPDLGTVRCGS